MNERIRVLAEQAGFSDDVHGVWPTITHTGEPVLNKFAELIVEECAKIADRPHPLIGTQIGNQIRTHFGVEL